MGYNDPVNDSVRVVFSQADQYPVLAIGNRGEEDKTLTPSRDIDLMMIKDLPDPIMMDVNE